MKRAIPFLFFLLLIGATCPAVNPFFFVRTALFTPPNIPGTHIDLWLFAPDASTISVSGSNVTQWNDKSGNGYNFSQATSSKQPTYSASGFNGRPAVIFNPADALSAPEYLSSTSFAQAQPLTIVFVGQQTSTGDLIDYSYILVDGAANWAFNSVVNSGDIAQVYAGGNLNSSVAMSGVHQWIEVINGSSSAVYTDGVLTGSGNPGSNGISGGPLDLGSLSTQKGWLGSMGELVIYSGAFNATQISQSHAYDKSIFGTP